MKNFNLFKKLLPVVLYFVITGSTYSLAQEVITPSAGYFETPSISLSWTIGEIAIETYVTDDIMLTQGFNQANIIITDVTEELSTDYKLIIYPNPAKDIFTLKAETENMQHLKAELYNLAGTKILSEQIMAGNTQFNIERLPASMYILRIYDNQHEIKSFKVIKTN